MVEDNRVLVAVASPKVFADTVADTYQRASAAVFVVLDQVETAAELESEELDTSAALVAQHID